MDLESYLQYNKLSLDPFALTNAEEEDLLGEYFVPPPYFASVRGDSKQPKSTIVFAPRGGGKTAQRRILEEDSRLEKSAFLCVLYDRFPVGAEVETHLDEICLRILVAILLTLEGDGLSGLALEKNDREFLLTQSSLLDSVDTETFDALVRSFKSDSRKMGDWLRDHSGPVKGVVAALLAKRGIELDPTMPWGPQMAKARETPPLSRLQRLIALSQSLGFDSVYVLIDRLDETATTNTDPKLAIDLVLTLLLDLKVMELPGLAVKVFAWDLSQEHYHESGGRRDRVKEFQLVWELDALDEMMQRRLRAYSQGEAGSLQNLCDPSVSFSLQKLATYMAKGSPRDMIRLGGHILAEHLRRPDATGKFTEADVWAGVRTFSLEISDERCKKFLPDLLRLEKYRFTQNVVANDILKISKQATGGKVASWRKTGMVEKIEEVQDARFRPQHLYGISDPRLAIALRPSFPVSEVLSYFAMECTHCSAVNVSDDIKFNCVGCKRELEAATTPSVMDACSL